MIENIKIFEINARHALGKSGMAELDYAFNPYLGCLHGCRYCYAIDMSPSEASSNWGRTVFVRKNIITLLEREARTYKRGIVGMSTITDPYQSVEMKFRIMPKAIEILSRNGFYVTIQTKSPLILKDIEILEKYRNNLDVGLTVTTIDRKVAALLEPYAPDPVKRLNALKKLTQRKIKTWLYLGPIVRGLNDNIEDIKKIVEFCAANGIRIIYDSYQDFKGTLPYMVGTGYMKSDPEWWERLNLSIEKICGKYGVTCTLEKDEWKYETRKRYGTLF
ncbi:radical SAM protein [Ferroplasma sp.]|uniref:SPL family radical SAM protein n=2 Tax=Ferroplasma TaxID=74968 RepID=UPI0026035939|nr:radical SAM protein [Ferroplasma sp.]